MFQEITGIILAGGASRRFGSDKAMARIGDQYAIQITANLLQGLFRHVLVSTHDAGRYAFLNLPVIADHYRDGGPLAGIHAALQCSRTKKNLLIACDLPLMNRELIEYLASHPSNKSITICKAAGRLQFFPGLYDRALLPRLEMMLSASSSLNQTKRHKSLYALAEKSGIGIIDAHGLPFYREELFYNMNEVGDHQKILGLISAGYRG